MAENTSSLDDVKKLSADILEAIRKAVSKAARNRGAS